MSEVNSGYLPTSKVEPVVTIVNGMQHLYSLYVFVVQSLRYKVNKYVRLFRLMVPRFSLNPNEGSKSYMTKNG